MSINAELIIRKQPKSTPLSIKISPVKVPPGAKQIGNYILGKTIGSGSYGKVHLGLHILTGQKVAVKIITKQNLSKSDAQRISRQIQILKKILHPSLIHLYQIIQTEKSLLFVTEYLQNGELFNYIIQRQRLPEEEACKIFGQIMNGIEYMHNLGIAHRDIKPENILLDFDGKVKIIDFGLSNFYQKNEKLRTQCGSPCYVPPEMIQGKHKYDPLLVDIWSCGIVLFAMIAGYLPFCDPDTSTLYKKIQQGKYKFPPWISDQAKDLISKMLVVNPNQRLKLTEIFQHPWFKKYKIKKSFGINCQVQKVPIEDSIVKHMAKLGIKTQKLVTSIQYNLKTSLTALYYIIARKMVREKNKVPTYFGSQYFQPQLVKLISKQDDYKQMQTILADVQNVSPIYKNSELSSPQTDTVNDLYNLKKANLIQVLEELVNFKIQIEDPMVTLMKGIFYANNLQNKMRKTNLNIKIRKASQRSATHQVKKIKMKNSITLRQMVRLPYITELKVKVKVKEKNSSCLQQKSPYKISPYKKKSRVVSKKLLPLVKPPQKTQKNTLL